MHTISLPSVGLARLMAPVVKRSVGVFLLPPPPKNPFPPVQL